MGRTARDNEATSEWAICGLVSGGAIVGYNGFELVNRKTGRAHQLHVFVGGISLGFSAGGTGSDISYTRFKTREDVTFDTFQAAGVRITSISAGVGYGYGWTSVTIYDGAVYFGPYLAKISLTGWAPMLPGLSVGAHGVAVLSYGSGKATGKVARAAIELPQECPPDPRLKRVKLSGMEEKLLIPSDVLFDFDRFTLRPEASAVLTKAAVIINERNKKRVTIVGHTDSIGKAAYNQTLSKKRAATVKEWLVNRGVPDAGLFVAKGEGESKPVAPNSNPDGSDNKDGRQKNRRVEFIFSS